ncbi:CCA tRNA nucleotidyltransferase [Glaciihabitans arcticus]|uniref:CCA tRNA nucleotidyltransferase n=1 Tax=Glaciihabitans arcticus TaxID=2668039 RepID=A0A4Q9GX98_9MICO|nr:HD domain-containing protein [Glaciihabitans arcticus]TBN57363.1 CCA tRNA nucleotidyltransferase [Glaciihabitans arcticus]
MAQLSLLDLTPGARAVVEACRRVGARPLVVGGAIRDALLGVASKDLDIEVHGVTDRALLLAALAEVGAVAEQGASFDVIAVRVDGADLDLSISDAPIDLAFSRRDFTINAMGWDPITDELIDPFGGQRDLARAILRHTSASFGDDPLRVLRGVQFVGRFGFALAAETKGVCRELAPRFDELATERVWEEWRKLARRARFWPEALDALKQTGWLAHFPDLDATRGVKQDPIWHSEGDVFTHLGLAAGKAAEFAERDGLSDTDREVAVLAALVHDFGKVTHTEIGERITSHGHAEAGVEPARAFLAEIGAPRHVEARILPVVREHMAHVSMQGSPSRPAVRRLMRRLGDASIHDWARVVDADCAGRGASSKASPAGAWVTIAESIGGAPARGLLTGEHLIARGLRPGPEFGRILGEALAAQDDEVFADEAGAVEWFDARAR